MWKSGAFGIQIGRSSRDIVLEKDVTVVSTVALPRRVTLNSIFTDLMADPESEKLLRPLIDSAMGIFRGEGDESSQEEAVTPEMEQAMLGYMPRARC
jgi:beta-glucosidase